MAETLATYKRKPRAISDDNSCFYYHSATGNKCAVGRCLKNPKKLADVTREIVDVWDVESYSSACPGLEKDLKPQYRGHSAEFWIDLQNFHDNPRFWNGYRLSAEGRKSYKEMRQRWATPPKRG